MIKEEIRMTQWTDEEIAAFKNAQTLQKRPYNDDQSSFAEDNPVWEVVVDNQVFIRGANGIKDTNWYQAGTKNVGQVEVAGQKFEVEYQAVERLSK